MPVAKGGMRRTGGEPAERRLHDREQPVSVQTVREQLHQVGPDHAPIELAGVAQPDGESGAAVPAVRLAACAQPSRLRRA